MELDFGDFDDDLFDASGRQLSNNLEEQIKSYRARQVDFEVITFLGNDKNFFFAFYLFLIKTFLAEEPNDEEIEDSSNLLKMKGDYHYFYKNYERALSFYQHSLGLNL